MAGSAGEYGVALLPRPRTRGGDGAGGTRQGVARAGAVAARGQLFDGLFALAANVFRSELKRFPTPDVRLEDAPEPTRGAAQLSDLTMRQSSDVVRRAVLALPVRYREPVILFYFHEMDVGAAARIMGMPEGTAKARLARARALLKKRFPHLEDEQAAMGLAEKEA